MRLDLDEIAPILMGTEISIFATPTSTYIWTGKSSYQAAYRYLTSSPLAFN